MSQSPVAPETLLWKPGDPVAEVEISSRAARSAERGVLWIFSNEITKKPLSIKPGTWCRFHGGGQFVGEGYFNPHSLIAGRIVSYEPVKEISQCLKDRLLSAFYLRRDLGERDSFRLFYSEADFIPGLIIDYYSGVLVLQSNTAGVDALLIYLKELAESCFVSVFEKPLKGFVMRGDSGIRRLENIADFVEVVKGDNEDLREAEFQSDGVRYAANFLDGQKTGFFLDQRDNRRFLTSWLKSRPAADVLDLFCYSGGWGLAALGAGAKNVVFVDENEPALQLARRGLDLNGKKGGEFVRSDAFDFLENDQRLYDVVVADPPAFVKSKKNLPQALKAYEKLNRLAWRRLKPGGILLSSSCSYHLAETEFFQLLHSAVSKEKGLAHVVYRGDQAADHPVLLSMPETRYLKCAALRKMAVRTSGQ